jgi:hypothetical protein
MEAGRNGTINETLSNIADMSNPGSGGREMRALPPVAVRERLMNRFYFDIHDGERFTRSEEGQLRPSGKAMGDAAIKVLPDIARDELSDGDRRDSTVKVRDEGGHYLFQAMLSLVAEWLDHQHG